MDPRTNPYNPGAGLRPAALAGRDADIEAFEILADRAQRGLVARSLVFSGLRGVGKTVLLAELAGRALERKWLVLQVEAEHTQPDHFSAALATELANAARRQQGWLTRNERQGPRGARLDHVVPGERRRGGGRTRVRARAGAGRQRQPAVRPRRPRRDRRLGGEGGRHRRRDLHRRDAGADHGPAIRGVSIVPSRRPVRSALVRHRRRLAEPADAARRGGVLRRAPVRLPGHRSSARGRRPVRARRTRGRAERRLASRRRPCRARRIRRLSLLPAAVRQDRLGCRDRPRRHRARRRGHRHRGRSEAARRRVLRVALGAGNEGRARAPARDGDRRRHPLEDRRRRRTARQTRLAITRDRRGRT